MTHYLQALEEAADQRGSLEAERDELRATVERYRAQVGKLSPLVREIMAAHRAPSSPDYNECEVDECAFCFDARMALNPEEEG